MASINVTLLYDVAKVLDIFRDITCDLIRKCNAAEPTLTDEQAKRISDLIFDISYTNDLGELHVKFDKLYKELANGADTCETVDKWYARAIGKDKETH